MSLNKEQQQQLLALAKRSIEHGLQTDLPLPINLEDFPPELREKRATFVTLEKHHHLRGCIGMLEAIRPLAEDVAENAFAAAFDDPRFPPLNIHELNDLEIHLSILSASEPMSFNSEQDLLSQLKPGIDGVILQEGQRRGTFLPSVWEQLPEPKQFLRHLKQKAGFSPDYWSDSLQVFRYWVEAIG
ncbi:MAG: AmmeMemoRadiSam system protein A [Methylococcaceae bacterium]|nr:AmmeMemoRadiSam system protein A [Methylococcaceae bacterium]MDP3021270.1 AmmeMemoRadiSam system protein A [Methylococcaceae bacterium]MDP3930949.1 AmmeMemoRadiSam system protein A [Methylococcaceae bacterium]